MCMLFCVLFASNLEKAVYSLGLDDNDKNIQYFEKKKKKTGNGAWLFHCSVWKSINDNEHLLNDTLFTPWA